MSDTTKRCFAIMPFDDSFDEIFEHVIREVATARGYHCHRADRTAGAVNLIQTMIHHICEADLVIADLSGGNANVFYELGVAHASCDRNKTVMIAEKETEIPFDIGPYNVLKYDRSIGGIKKLQEDMTEHVDVIEKRNGAAANPVQDYLVARGKREFLPMGTPTATAGAFEQMRGSLVRLGVLSLLESWPEGRDAPSLTEICRALGVRSRKSAFEALQYLRDEGWIEQTRAKNALWQLSERGRRMLERLRPVAKVRIETGAG